VVQLENLDVVVENYISNQQKIKPYLDGRIRDHTQHDIKPMNIHEPIHFGYLDEINTT